MKYLIYAGVNNLIYKQQTFFTKKISSTFPFYSHASWTMSWTLWDSFIQLLAHAASKLFCFHYFCWCSLWYTGHWLWNKPFQVTLSPQMMLGIVVKWVKVTLKSTFTKWHLWQQPFWISEVFSYLSWLCSSSISVLCSVTVFRKCWLVCVWQERQDCHLCGMTPNTHLELYPRTNFPLKLLSQHFLCPFGTNLKKPVSHSRLQSQ